jgi:hypothetical protein
MATSQMGSGPAASIRTPKVKIVVGHGATPKTGREHGEELVDSEWEHGLASLDACASSSTRRGRH